MYLGPIECMTTAIIVWASINLSVTRLRCANTGKRIEVLLKVETFGDRKNITRWFQFSSLIQCGLSQVTLATCFNTD